MDSTIYVGNPRRGPFPLTQADFDQALIERFPDVRLTHRTVRGRDYTSFDLDLDRQTRTAEFTSAGNLVLRDGNGTVWAPFLTWFLTLIPGYPAQMMVEAVHPDSAAIPAGATPADITAVYEQLVASVA